MSDKKEIPSVVVVSDKKLGLLEAKTLVKEVLAKLKEYKPTSCHPTLWPRIKAAQQHCHDALKYIELGHICSYLSLYGIALLSFDQKISRKEEDELVSRIKSIQFHS
jgi:hypothetical protein